ncbi:uncharacterized protein SCHCODRAFT_02745939 [Schizophyllum commune H4-8]|nr:uncharacterized protein SCHCODRAFT_02745939 [Schizophyllum commune H4-8]KAI5897069.1 hypothetical protein SCHCODRAFT_02745939 [Schizophyllum commune H4-8]
MSSLDLICRADDVIQGVSACGADLRQHAEGQLHSIQPGADSLPRPVDSYENGLFPINKLSAETLSIIIDFYLSEDTFVYAPMEVKLRWFMHPVDRGPCVLLRVCSLWRRICTTRFASYYASLIVSISQGTIPPLPEGREYDPSVDGVFVGQCLRHYLELFSRGSFVLTMEHGARRPAVIPQEGLLDPAVEPSLDVADTMLASLAQRYRELIVRPSKDEVLKHSIQTAANALYTLWPAQGLLHRLETLSIDFGDITRRGTSLRSSEEWRILAQTKLFAHAPKLCRLKLWRRAIHVLDAHHPLDLPSKQIKDFSCQYYEPRSCLAALLQFPSLTTLTLLRYVSYKAHTDATALDRHRLCVDAPQNTRNPRPVTTPIRLAHLSHLSVFCQHGCVDGSQRNFYYIADLLKYPDEILDWIYAPALQRLRIGFASNEAPFGRRPLTVIRTIGSFLRRSRCALVELFVFLHTEETDEHWLKLFGCLPSLREVTLGMSYGVRLSAKVLRALRVAPERQLLLPHLRRLTLITDESPALDIETYALAEAIESRIGAHERTGGIADDLEIFQLACQGTHRFVWDKEMKTRMKSWVRQGLCVGLAVVDVALPTEFIDIRDQGNFLMDWEWIRYYDDDDE